MDSSMLSRFAFDAPYVMIMVFGLVFALIRWRMHPRLSMLLAAVLGLGLFRLVVFDLALPMAQGLLRLTPMQLYGNPLYRLLSLALGVLVYGGLVFAAFYGFHEASRGRE